MSGLFQKEFKKKKKKEKAHFPLRVCARGVTGLKGLFLYCSVDLVPISEILCCLFFFFSFGHFPIQVSQRPERQKELTCWAAFLILFYYINTVIIPDDKPGSGVENVNWEELLDSLSCLKHLFHEVWIKYTFYASFIQSVSSLMILKTVELCQSTGTTNRL